MRATLVVLLVASLFFACESPQDLSSEQNLYKGRVIQEGPAPFLLNGNSLSKDADGIIILDEEVPDGTVYGLKNDDAVYSADGGEVLPKKSWVANESSEPVEVSLTSNLTMTFVSLCEVTIVEAVDMVYTDANGDLVVFSGSGVITTTSISTGSDGLVTLISSVEFAIGGEGGEIG